MKPQPTLITLKPIFEALRMIKESERADEKVRTLENPASSEVWEYLEEQIEQLVNSNVRTLKTLIVPNEKAPEGANSVNGATDLGIIELFGEDEMPILLPDSGKYTYKNLICIMKQCTQTYYNIRTILQFLKSFLLLLESKRPVRVNNE